MFNVGDIVVGTSANRYNFTGAGSVCRVVPNLIGTAENFMRVEVIKPAPDHCSPGGEFTVLPKYFELQTPGSPCISDEDFEKLFA